MAPSRAWLLFPLLAAACSAPAAEDPASSALSNVTTATRVLDARTTPRFFRKHGSNASKVIDVGGGVGFFFGHHPSPDDGRDLIYLERTEGTTATTRTLSPVPAVPEDAVAFDGALYFTTRYDNPDSPYNGQRLLARVDANATALSWVLVEGDVQTVAVHGGTLWVVSRIGADARISKLEADGNTQTFWQGPAGSDLQLVATSDGLLVRIDDRCELVTIGSGGPGPHAPPHPESTRTVLASGAGQVYANDASLFVRTTTGALTRVLAVNDPSFDIPYGTAPDGAFASIHGRTVIFGAKGYIYGINEGAHWVEKLSEASSASAWTAPVELDGKLYVRDRRTDALFATDGTPLGTGQVGDYGGFPSDSDAITALDGALYIVGIPDRADGAPPGFGPLEVLRVDPRTGKRTAVTSFPDDASIEHLTTLGGKVVLSAGGDETELWSVAGNTAAMIEANPYGNASSGVRAFAATDRDLFFTTEEDVPRFSTKRTALWATDGIVPVQPVQLAVGDFDLELRTSVGDLLCVFEKTAKSWLCTNGTPEGTKTVSGDPLVPVAFNGALYFSSSTSLKRLDALTAQTTTVQRFDERVTNIAVVGDQLLLTVRGMHGDAGIWIGNGTTFTRNGNVDFAEDGVTYLASAGGFAYFRNGVHLLATDGGFYTSQFLADFDTEVSTKGVVLGNAFYVTTKNQLWRADGLIPTRLYQLDPGVSFIADSTPAVAGGNIAFRADKDIVVTNGTPGQTYRYGGVSGADIAALPSGNFLVSPFGTSLATLAPASGALTPFDLAGGATAFFPVPAGALFVGERNGSGQELLFTNGAAGGTRVVTESFPGPGSSNPHDLVSFRSRVFYTSTDATGDEELYVVAMPH